MPNPFDTGIRLTVVSDDDNRTTCSVDEFVLCPTNARADEWQRLAEAEAREHLATTKRLVEAEAALAAARAELERARGASDRMVDAFSSTLDRIASAMGCDPDPESDLVEAVRLLVQERDAAVQRAERAERLHAEAESDLARVSVRLAEAEAP